VVPRPVVKTNWASRWRRGGGVDLVCRMCLRQWQTGPNVSDKRVAIIEEICRQYAAAVTGMPRDLMFNQCMSERHCWVSSGSTGYQCEAPQPMSWHGGGY
jgi:hypothetical protein